MPFLFPQTTYYKIDYEKLQSELLSDTEGKLFHSNKMRKNYLNYWINLMKETEQNMNLFAQNTHNKEQIKSFFRNHETYHFTTDYSDFSIFIHFNISNIILNLPLEYKKNAILIDIKRYSPEGDFLWFPISNFDTTRSIKQTPIIAIPHISKQTEFLAIDGNTRLTSWINDKEKIPTIFVDPNFLIQNELFCSKFDELYYCFRHDLISLVELFSKTNISDNSLLNLSFIKTGRLLFDN